MLGFLLAGADPVFCAWAYPINMLKANVHRTENRMQLEMFI
jgi:hypothetical protein